MDYKQFFTPDDVKLIRYVEQIKDEYDGNAPECRWSPVQRMNLIDPEIPLRCALGQIVANLVMELIERGDTVNTILSKLLSEPELRELIHTTRVGDANTNMGGMSILMMPMMYKLCDGRYFQIRDQLNEQLEFADIGAKMPLNYFRAPYPNMYIEFGKERKHLCDAAKLHNTISGDHFCEGVFINQFTVEDPTKEMSRSTIAGMRIDPNQPVRIMHLVFTGSPMDKEGLLDDASCEITLFFQDEALTIEESLKRHYQYYFNLYQITIEGESEEVALREASSNMSDKEARFFTWGIQHLAKILLYINSEQCEREEFKERSLILEQIARVAPKKQAKLKRKLAKATDVIYIGSKIANKSWQQGGSQDRKSHWRRGHFRNQRYGEKLSKSKSIWIEPALVGSGETGKSKSYVIR